MFATESEGDGTKKGRARGARPFTQKESTGVELQNDEIRIRSATTRTARTSSLPWATISRSSTPPLCLSPVYR